MDYQTLVTQLERHPETVVLDVRSPEQYHTQHLPQAVNIPLAELPTRLNELAPERPVVVYCTQGRKSLEGVAVLEAAGFEQVMNLDGGLSQIADIQ